MYQTIFSDEVSCQNSSSDPTTWLFRFPSEKYHRDFVNLRNHVKANISIMMWGAIWRGGRSELIVIRRDKDSAKGGYSVKSYQNALSEGLLPIYDGTRYFQQDNSKLHVCEATQAWLQARGIEYIDWPAHSPDLNPIEHVWAVLKRRLKKYHPDLFELKKNKLDIAEFTHCVRQEWWAIEQVEIDRLIDSMPRRLAAVRKVRGWYTKY